ncbi:MAG: nicotinate-nucleotide--dimethylbenzimidazole phosphoribosyltransferase [Polaromonas sp.]|uniref:nicotinate-nucleotide--dimethylbenzimidazole phosphoribosyltransferase n=1 Tax=Polaromonas sp. TaxID=1869339 RepID=UPI00248A7726|nr:nicotinate-nucleotide--dimethylbenzimidazole phosphoribosyltransferase [Polaromonas sp.]MDI1236262.1 nicotinate-nucleotide--dimethylbenzimidazole phosphoribosyltransferase [Polaromonas sp.]
MTDNQTFLLPAIESTADAALAARLQHRIDQKTKPLGALGQLEALALQLGLIQRSEAISFHAPQMVVFAADHGIASEGVSAFPQAVTVQMVGNMLAGGAAINVFARQHGFALQVVDAGVAADLADHPQLQQRKIAPGTQNICEGPAMSPAQARAALQAGMDVMQGLPGNVVAFGEMGIANTSPAALLLARLAGLPVGDVVGRGTGLDDAQLAHKQAVLQRALARHADVREPLAVLAALGGFEIAMMAGAMLQAASERRAVLVDGFIAGAAALVARALVPQVRDYLVFCHRSAERGHQLLLAHLQATPLLDLDMRLGEGTGALLAWPLLQSAALFMAEMASFDSAGVSGKAEAPTLVTACTSLPPEGAHFALGRPGGET